MLTPWFSLFVVLLLLGPDLPLLLLRCGSAVMASQPAGLLSNPHRRTLTLSSIVLILFLCHFRHFFGLSSSLCFLLLSSPLFSFSPSFPLLLRTVKAVVTASPPPCWSLRTTRRSKRTRSASVRERPSKSWPPISRTCTLFTGQLTANHLPQRAGCRG